MDFYVACYFITGLYCLQVLVLKELKKRGGRDFDEDDKDFDILPIDSDEDYHTFKKKIAEVESLKKKLVSKLLLAIYIENPFVITFV